MKKERIKSLAVVLCMTAVIATVASGTSAFFTEEERAHNVITTGNVDIDLIEMADLDGDGKGDVQFEDVKGVTPGEEVSKIVTVENTGSQPAYVRILVDKTITLKDNPTEKEDESLVECDINTTDWKEQDGFYYYNTPLEAGAETAPLFTTVTFSEKMGNLYQSSEISIDIQAQATQVANNGATVFDALGWPAE